MFSIEEHFYEEFIHTARSIGGAFALCSSGNLSMRVNESICLISKAGSWLTNMDRDQIAICNYKTYESLNGLKQSTEHNVHFGIYNTRPDVNVVMHTQPMYATTIACRKNRPASYNLTAEIPCYIGEVAEVPYIRPGSVELANSVVEAMKNHQVVMMLNHGIVVVGSNVSEAYQRTSFFEMACMFIVQSGGDYNLLSDQQLKDIDHYILGKS